jgi:hypothetical protein
MTVKGGKYAKSQVCRSEKRSERGRGGTLTPPFSGTVADLSLVSAYVTLYLTGEVLAILVTFAL